MQDYINALFGGQQRHLRLRRETLAAFERELRGSAHALLRRLAQGDWTRCDVELVLEYAMLTDSTAEALTGPAGLAMPRTFRGPLVGRTEVQRFLDAHPIAPYAVLAARLLEAALYGIEADAAHFDEGAELGAVA
ncbi:hypothetical protein [Ancylobacter radicis]|uniref:Uncharacterized protein n=1 Tax=Ancylobacter radicis TaxID=2836179 RepID=A0ABS5R7L2_9HYPH|nr:hypothetical protein [Ancylobacter radicis]MBS9477654.1 hypothetical protein [Ancylobacter radicis]